MKRTKQVDKHTVYSQWLKSELYRVKESLPEEDIKLIEQPNIQDINENIKRENFLLYKYGRIAILKHLPSNISWHKVILEANDIESLHILPIFDWFMDTGRTFKLKDTLKNLAPNRGYHLSDSLKGDISHYQKVAEMNKTKGKTIHQDIVMISTGLSDKPLTIIDGTHRSTHLHQNNKLPGTTGFLGVADDLSSCIWSIERGDINNHLTALNQYANVGMLW